MSLLRRPEKARVGLLAEIVARRPEDRAMEGPPGSPRLTKALHCRFEEWNHGDLVVLRTT